MAHDLCPRPLRPPADIAVGRTASAFQAFRRPVMPLSPLVCYPAADLVPYCHRCAFSPSAFMYVGVGGFRRYPVHGELLSACLRTLLRGARLRPFRLSGVPSCRFLLLYAILRLTLYRIATAALFLHPLSCTLALAASGVILSMKCSLLALLSCRFGVLFFSLPVTRPLRRDIVKKECARACTGVKHR